MQRQREDKQQREVDHVLNVYEALSERFRQRLSVLQQKEREIFARHQ